MNEQGAKRWLVVSALVVAGVWGYRRWREGPAAVAELPKFFTAWGVTYFVLALVGEAAPRVGGAFSILVMTADIISQGKPLINDITGQEAGKAAAGGGGSGATATVGPSSTVPATASVNPSSVTGIPTSRVPALSPTPPAAHHSPVVPGLW